ncbi:ATP-binding protein, partial [Thermodesulfobacteriota bacterium]
SFAGNMVCKNFYYIPPEEFLKTDKGAYNPDRLIDNIVSREHAEEALQESEADLKEAQFIAHIGRWELNLTTHDLHWSNNIFDIFELDPTEFGASYDAFLAAVHPDDREKVKQAYTQSLSGRQPYNIEHRLLMKDGRVKWVYEKCRTDYGAQGQPVRSVGIVQDITERKRIEEEKEELWKQLLQSQKLAAVGRLTGGIAHDFNNILQTTIGFSSMLYMQMSDDNPQKDIVKRIYKCGEKASKLIEQLLVFSKKQALDIKAMNPNAAIESILDMCRRMVGEDVKLIAELDPAINKIMADEIQLEQVIMNLLVNARDAMPTGGEIMIKSRNIKLDKESAKVSPELKTGAYVELSVKDSGHGISKDIKGNIFDPFFTTKKEGKGTGLGLSTVFGIVKQHNGVITVESKVNVGTEFKVYFPATEKEVSAGEKITGKITSGNETILITEDDPDVMMLFAKSLEAEGYKVIQAESGEKALNNSATYDGDIDLLLSDVIMTGMDGFELSKEIREKRPAIKTFFVSGFIGDADILRTLKNGKIPFTKKPVTPMELARRVRQVLDS